MSGSQSGVPAKINFYSRCKPAYGQRVNIAIHKCCFSQIILRCDRLHDIWRKETITQYHGSGIACKELVRKSINLVDRQTHDSILKFQRNPGVYYPAFLPLHTSTERNKNFTL